jgi:ATP-dependent Clp protease ATP-binding subunit ClpX
MYGGYGETAESLAEKIKRTCIGQDETVDKLCQFAELASVRSRRIVREKCRPLELPTLNSALIIGPTASGKSHMMKTFAYEAGMSFRSIDANAMSGEGWRGDNFSTVWFELSQQMEKRPYTNAVVFIDEVDKMLAQKREGNAMFDLLKPLEGGILQGHTGESTPREYSLNTDRCLFILAGAFTGIEKIVAKRVGASKHGMGFGATVEDGLPTDERERERALRAQVTTDDIEAWGCPRELLGRIAHVWPMEALGEDALRTMLHGNVQREYERMLEHGTFVIDDAATDLIVERALKSRYGARSVNQQVCEAFTNVVWPQIKGMGGLESATLTVSDGEFACEAKECQYPSLDQWAAQQQATKQRLSDSSEAEEPQEGEPAQDEKPQAEPQAE